MPNGEVVSGIDWQQFAAEVTPEAASGIDWQEFASSFPPLTPKTPTEVGLSTFRREIGIKRPLGYYLRQVIRDIVLPPIERQTLGGTPPDFMTKLQGNPELARQVYEETSRLLDEFMVERPSRELWDRIGLKAKPPKNIIEAAEPGRLFANFAAGVARFPAGISRFITQLPLAAAHYASQAIAKLEATPQDAANIQARATDALASTVEALSGIFHPRLSIQDRAMMAAGDPVGSILVPLLVASGLASRATNLGQQVKRVGAFAKSAHQGKIPLKEWRAAWAPWRKAQASYEAAIKANPELAKSLDPSQILHDAIYEATSGQVRAGAEPWQRAYPEAPAAVAIPPAQKAWAAGQRQAARAGARATMAARRAPAAAPEAAAPRALPAPPGMPWGPPRTLPPAIRQWKPEIAPILRAGAPMPSAMAVPRPAPPIPQEAGAAARQYEAIRPRGAMPRPEIAPVAPRILPAQVPPEAAKARPVEQPAIGPQAEGRALWEEGDKWIRRAAETKSNADAQMAEAYYMKSLEAAAARPAEVPIVPDAIAEAVRLFPKEALKPPEVVSPVDKELATAAAQAAEIPGMKVEYMHGALGVPGREPPPKPLPPLPPEALGEVKVPGVSDEQIAARIQAAERGELDPGWLPKAREWGKQLVRVATRTFPEIPNEAPFYPVQEHLRFVPIVQNNARLQAARVTQHIFAPLRGDIPRKILVGRHIAMEDLVHWHEQEGLPLRFGFDEKRAVGYRDKLRRLAEEDPAIQDMLERRHDFRGKLLHEAVRRQVLPEHVLENVDAYFRREVFAYASTSAYRPSVAPRMRKPSVAQARIRAEELPKKMREMVAEEGLPQMFDYSLNLEQAELHAYQQIMANIAKADWLGTLDNVEGLAYAQAEGQDIQSVLEAPSLTETMRAEAKAAGVGLQRHIRDEHPELTMWHAAPSTIWYQASTVSEQMAQKVLEDVMGKEKFAELLPDEVKDYADQIRDALEIDSTGADLVMRNEVAATLDKMLRAPDRNWLVNAHSDFIKAWKSSVLMAPHVYLSFRGRNVTGDALGLFILSPRAFAEVPGSIGQMYKWAKDKPLDADAQIARELGVFEGITAKEIPDLKEIQTFNIGKRFFGPMARPQLVTGAMRDYFTFVKRWDRAFEGVCRLAAFRYSRKQLQAYEAGKGEFPYTGAANAGRAKEIYAAFGVDRCAAYMANESIGAYDTLTALGQILRKTVSPFHSWTEIAVKRPIRATINAIEAGKFAGAKNGGLILAGAITAQHMLKILFGYLGQWGWNHFVMGDLEKKLSDAEKRVPHLLFGETEDKRIKIFRRVGYLSDPIELLGLDMVMQYVPRLIDGTVSVERALKEIAKAPMNAAVQSFDPLVKFAHTILTGTSLWPDAFNPRRVRRIEAPFTLFRLQQPYRAAEAALLKGGRKARPHALLQAMGISTLDPVMQGYTKIRDWADDYCEKHGIAKYKDTSAFWRMRTATLAKDLETFREGRQSYLKAGNTRRQFFRRLNRRSLDPLNAAMARKHHQDFLESLPKERREEAGPIRREWTDVMARMEYYWGLCEEQEEQREE